MAEYKDMGSSPPARIPKLQLIVEQPSTGGHWSPPKKRHPRPKTKKLQGDGRRGCNHNKIKSHTLWVGDPQMGEQEHQRSSPTVVKVWNPMSGFPAWGPSKGTGNPQGI